MRTQNEILDAEEEFFNRVWYDRHLMAMSSHERGDKAIPPDILKGALKAAERAKSEYPDIAPAATDFEWGMWNGKLSALRWVLGDDWDFLDT